MGFENEQLLDFSGYLTSATAATTYLKVNQATPQTIIGGAPTFDIGFNLYSGQMPFRTNTGGTTPGSSLFIGNDTGTPTSRYSICVGEQAGKGQSSASTHIIAFGYRAGYVNNKNITSGLFMGYQAGYQSDGSNSTYIGNYAGNQAVGGGNVFVGGGAGSNATGGNSGGFGPSAFANCVHNASLALGTQAFANSNNPGGGNTAVGFYSGIESTNMQYATVIGSSAGRGSNRMTGSFVAGDTAGAYSDLIQNGTVIGTNACNSATKFQNSIAIGNSAGQSTYAVSAIYVGDQAGSQARGNNCTYIGGYAGGASIGDGIVGIGPSTASSLVSANYLTGIGGSAGANAYYAQYSTFISLGAGAYASNARNSLFMGYYAGNAAIKAANSIFLGYNAGVNDTVDNATRGSINGVAILTAGATGFNVNDIGTVASGDGNATVKVTAIDFGEISAVSIASGGFGYFVGDIVTVNGGYTYAQIQIDSTDGIPSLILTTNPTPVFGGFGYVIGDIVGIFDSAGQNAQITVDSTDGTSGGVATVTPNADGTGYFVGDYLTLQSGDYSAIVEVTAVGGSGEVTAVNIVSMGSTYGTGLTYTSGGSGDGMATITIDTIYFGTILTYTLTAQGFNYLVGNTTYDSAITGTGYGVIIEILSVGSDIGEVLSCSIVGGYAGTLYSLGTQATSNLYVTNGMAGNFSVNIDDIANGTPTAIVKDTVGTGYIQGGQGYENQVTGIGGDTMYILINTLTSEVEGGSNILIGNYTSTGGYSDSIGIGRGVMNSATLQANIGNVLFLDGIYANNTPSATPMTAGILSVGGVIKLPDYSLFTGTPVQGMVGFDFINNYPVFYDGANWVQI